MICFQMVPYYLSSLKDIISVWTMAVKKVKKKKQEKDLNRVQKTLFFLAVI